MAKFKVGDRVRLVRGENEWSMKLNGTEYVCKGRRHFVRGGWCWLVPCENPVSDMIFWYEYDMEPLTHPHQKAWEEFKALHLVGKPELVKA